MKQSPFPCVVLSDYPIKTVTYQRFLSSLGEEDVLVFRSLAGDSLRKACRAKLVVCDMNIMEEFEPEALAQIECLFPNANILFLEEDHSDMKIRFSGQRDICRLGKLTEINVIYSTIKELLLQSGQSLKRVSGSETRQAEKT